MKFVLDRVYLALIIIIVAGGILRLYLLNWETLSFDEVVIAYHSSQEYLKGNFLYNFYSFDTPPLGKYIFALAFGIFGFSDGALRLFPALAGTATIILTYLICNRLYKNKLMSLFAASFVAFSIIHIQFSRFANADVLLSLFVLLSIYFTLKLAENRKDRTYVFLGASVALGLLTKYLMLYVIFGILVYTVYKKLITASLGKSLEISVNKNLIKAFVVFLAVFFIVWPFSLYPIKSQVSLYVVNDGTHGGSLTLPIPYVLLTFGNVGSSVVGERTDINNVQGFSVRNFYVAGYFVLFLVKENIVLVLATLTGVYAACRRRNETDKIILLILVLFFVALWIQKWGYTYRYISSMTPLISIIAAGSIDLVKGNGRKIALALVVCVVAAAIAILYHPSYTFYYNQLNSVFNVPDPEAYYSEGTKAALDSVADCSSVYTNYDYVIEPYIGYKMVNSTSARPSCIIVGRANTPNKQSLVEYATNNCRLDKKIEKYGIELFDTYRC